MSRYSTFSAGADPTSGVLSEAWEHYKAHWRHLLAISFSVYLSVAVVDAVLTHVLTWLGALIAFVIYVIALFWVQGALSLAVDDIRDGRADLSIGDTFARTRPLIGSIGLVSVLAGLGIGVGLIFFIVPGLVLLTWWLLVIPIVVLEGSPPMEAFGRSHDLVRGHGMGVFWVIVKTFLLLLAFSLVLNIAFAPIASWLQGFLSGIITGTLTTPFIALAWTLLYFRLRGVKG